MAPTIEYPAQQCEASPKSLHMVLFYINNIFVLVLFVFAIQSRYDSRGWVIVVSVVIAVLVMPSTILQQFTIAEQPQRCCSLRVERTDFPTGLSELASSQSSSIHTKPTDSYICFIIEDDGLQNFPMRVWSEESNQWERTIWGSNESKISCEKESIVFVTVKRTIKMYTS